jgi:hypothetical protein
MNALAPPRRPVARATGALLLIAAALASGCRAAAPRIQHIVLFALDDPTRAAELLADADAVLPGIPGVRSYASGTPLDLGRAGVATDFDVGFVVGFASRSAYLAYLDHPDHEALAARWRPHVAGARIVDVAADDAE